jgi:hypothetical protein
LLDQLEAGDVVTVTRLDRLARSTRDLLNTLAAITGYFARRVTFLPCADMTDAPGRGKATRFRKRRRCMFRTFLFLAVATLLFPPPPAHAADNDASGAMFYQSCMAAASIMEGNAPTDALDKAPMCFGAITAIVKLQPFLKPEYAMCPPTGSKISYAQMILVIASYLKNHPEQLDKNFHMLALVALNTAWPCSTDH